MGVTALPAITIACQRDKPRRTTAWPYRDPADVPHSSAAQLAGLWDLMAKRHDPTKPTTRYRPAPTTCSADPPV
jgi:hypothetical protein